MTNVSQSAVSTPEETLNGHNPWITDIVLIRTYRNWKGEGNEMGGCSGRPKVIRRMRWVGAEGDQRPPGSV